MICINEDKSLIDMFYLADEFIWRLYSNNIFIHNNCSFYDELLKIMNNRYIFQSGIPSMKDDNTLVWLSDQYCDIDDVESVNRINRLVIRRLDDSFLISVENPYLDKLNIIKDSYIIAFSPLFNGYFSRNVESGMSLQDDFCLMYQELKIKNERVLK